MTKLLTLLYGMCLAHLMDAGTTTSLVASPLRTNNLRAGGVGAKQPLLPSNNNPLRVFVQTIQNAKRHLVAAAAARGTSIVTMYPLDTFKVRVLHTEPIGGNG